MQNVVLSLGIGAADIGYSIGAKVVYRATPGDGIFIVDNIADTFRPDGTKYQTAYIARAITSMESESYSVSPDLLRLATEADYLIQKTSQINPKVSLAAKQLPGQRGDTPWYRNPIVWVIGSVATIGVGSLLIYRSRTR